MNATTERVDLRPEDAFFAYHAGATYLLTENEPYDWENWAKEDLRNALVKIQTGGRGVTMPVVELKALVEGVAKGMDEAPVEHPDPRSVLNELISILPSEYPDKTYYGGDWREIREQVLKRDSYNCVECGISNKKHLSKYGMGLHVHHIEPIRKFDDITEANQYENLVTVCAACHLGLEDKPKDAFDGVDLGI